MENDSMEDSNDESATVSQEQLDEWAGLSADEINDDQGASQSEEGIESKDAATLTAEEFMEGPGKEERTTTEEDSDLVAMINGLSPIHNNVPFEIKSQQEAVEFMQKGYDYTQKMQSLSKEKETAYAEYDQKVEELERGYADYAETINKSQVFDYALKNMEETDPLLFEQVMGHVNSSTQSFNNPVVSSLQNKINALEEKFASTVYAGENQNIQSNYARDMEAFQKEIAPSAKNLGLVPNWDKVTELWKRDSKGEMSVKQAFYALYGEDIQKLRASKQTVANTQRKSAGAKKIPTAATTSGSKAGGGNSSNDYSGMSLEQAAMKIAFG